eukprot:snap_masked-scaffold_4-processed-gene-21.36-mRNA-1 protein AED:0.79 eAED:0.79 QI:0/0/0/0.5/1/1/2/0/230
MTTIYDFRNDYELSCWKVNNILYIQTRTHSSEHSRTDSQLKFMYHGYKFETLCTEGESAEVDSTSCYNSVLSNLKLVYGAEIDALEENADKKSFVEIKATGVLDNEKERKKFEKKMLRFYAQSFLADTRKVFVGFRTREGILRKVQSFKTFDIPNMVNSGKKRKVWDKDICILFLHKVLQFLLEQIPNATTEDYDVYQVKYQSKLSKITICKDMKRPYEQIEAELFLSNE